MHFRLQFAFASILSITLLSCDNGSKTDKEIIKAMEESLQKSILTIETSGEEAFFELGEKRLMPSSANRAERWYPKAEKVLNLTKECFTYIEELKKEKTISKEKSAALFSLLHKFKADVIAVDSLIYQHLSSNFKLLHPADSSINSEKKFYNKFLKNATEKSTSAFFTNLQFEVKYFGRNTIIFCNEQIGGYEDLFNSYSAIIAQNSKVVEPGKEIEIIAGIGAFSKASMPSITINGHKFQIDEHGTTRYKFAVSKKPGKYSIPVKIDFVNENGEKQTIESKTEYTVAKICNE